MANLREPNMEDIMTDYKFDLQLFADGDVVQPEGQPAVDQQNTTPTMEFNYALDDKGNLIINEDYVAPQPNQPEAIVPYTPEEMSRLNWETDKLDPRRIPNEMQAWYKSMQAGFTRGTQALAEKTKQLEAQMATIEAQRNAILQQSNQQFQQEINQQFAPVQQQQVPQQLQQQVDPRQAYYNDLKDNAIAMVEQVTGSKYDEYDPYHQVIMADAVADLKARMVQATQYQNNLQAMINKHSQDPEWANIYNYADEKLKNLPYSQGVEAMNRINSGDIAFMDSFLNGAKDEYYAKKQEPQQQQDKVAELLEKARTSGKVQPPIVESGNTFQVESKKEETVDLKEFGRMSNFDQIQQLKKLGLI